MSCPRGHVSHRTTAIKRISTLGLSASVERVAVSCVRFGIEHGSVLVYVDASLECWALWPKCLQAEEHFRNNPQFCLGVFTFTRAGTSNGLAVADIALVQEMLEDEVAQRLGMKKETK